MSTPPRNQFSHIIIRDLGNWLVFAKELDQIADLPLGIIGPSMVLPNFQPVAAGNIIEPQ